METKTSLTAFLNKTTPVVLVANENIDGNPIITPLMDQDGTTPKTDLNGKELGSIRLEQHTQSLANGSFLNVRRRVAFISGTLEVLNSIVKANNLKAGMELPGKIIITESTEPFWKNQQPKINPQTDESIGVTLNEKFFPIFMKMTYMEDGSGKDYLLRTPEDLVNHLAARAALAATPTTPVETAGMPKAEATK
jgi:hypothetical protein